MTLKRLEDRRRGLADALDADPPATKPEKGSHPYSNRAFRPNDIDELVLGTTNAPYRRTMSSTDLVARITSRDWRN